jgi:hypothetical protein
MQGVQFGSREPKEVFARVVDILEVVRVQIHGTIPSPNLDQETELE